MVDLDEAQKLKQAGTDLFKKGSYPEAIEKYSACLTALDSSVDSDDEPEEENPANDDEDPEVKRQTSELEQACHLNCAICYLKQTDQQDQAISSASKVLALNAEHVKALYWRGKAYHQLNKLDKAKKDLLSAAKLDPKNKPARSELQSVTEKLKVQDAKSKAARKKKAGFLSGDKGVSMYGEKDDLGAIKAKNAKKQKDEEAKKRKEAEKEAKKKKKAAKPSKSNFNPGDANDYSKWDNLDDSDSEEEEEEKVRSNSKCLVAPMLCVSFVLCVIPSGCQEARSF